MVELPEKGDYRRIKDNLLVRVTGCSPNESLVYVGRVQLDNTVGTQWTVLTENFWDHYKKVEEDGL